MVTSGIRPIRISVIALAIIVAAVTFFFTGSPNTADAATRFDTTFEVKLCNDLATAFGDPELNGGGGTCVDTPIPLDTAVDITTTLCVPGPSDLVDGTCDSPDPDPGNPSKNFSAILTFTPESYPLNVAGSADGLGADIPVGEKVGGLDSLVGLAGLNGNCLSNLPVPFTLYNVGLPSDLNNPRSSTNIVFPQPQGTADRFGRWQEDTEPAAGGGTAIADTSPADNNADGGTANLSITGYPSYLLDLFDPDWTPTSDGPDKPAVPVVIYGGLRQPVPVSNDWVPLYFVVFDPGVLAAAFAAPHPFSRAHAELGRASVAVLNDTTSTVTSISPVSDFCSPVRTVTMLLGTTPGGQTRTKTPTAIETSFFPNYAASLRDADKDGRENVYDTCPTTADGFGTGDLGFDDDADGIYNSCDPTPGVAGCGGGFPGPFNDCDDDGFLNRQDNCALIANGLPSGGGDGQRNNEEFLTAYPSDGGPRNDNIGDVCDADDVTSDGKFDVVGIVNVKCVGGTDGDNDGYCLEDEEISTPTDANSSQHKAWTIPGHPLAGNASIFDTDRAGGDKIPVNGTIDGLVDADWQEQFQGTDGSLSCNAGPGGLPIGTAESGTNATLTDNSPNASPFGATDSQVGRQVVLTGGTGYDAVSVPKTTQIRTIASNTANALTVSPDWDTNPDATTKYQILGNAWTFDINGDGKATLADILADIPFFNSPTNKPYVARMDHNNDGFITLADVLAYIPAFNSDCITP